jgi:hypothetical protein
MRCASRRVGGEPELAINGLGGDYSPQVGMALQFHDHLGGKIQGSVRVSQY